MLTPLLDQSFRPVEALAPLGAIALTPRWLTLVGTLLLTSCTTPLSPPDEQGLRQDLEAFCRGQNRPVESFERVGDRDWQRGTVELYAGVCGAGSTSSPLFVEIPSGQSDRCIATRYSPSE
ncbi:hypothetical protein C7271_09105 [filamentous cyanobacterium CCP5]|nr:hypothetical protein C7271_09105 [filamentous cyanobacterium CCP5]